MRIQWKNKSLDLFRSRVYMCTYTVSEKQKPAPLAENSKRKKVSTFKLLTIRRREGERERKKIEEKDSRMKKCKKKSVPE